MMKKHRKSLFPNNNSYNGTSKSLRFLKCFIGYISFLFLWISIMLSVAIFVFESDWDTYIIPLVFSVCLYILTFIVSCLVAFKLEKRDPSMKNILKIFFIDLINGLRYPFIYLKGFIIFIIFSILQIIPFINNITYKHNTKNLGLAILYIISISLVFVAFNMIAGIKMDDYLYCFSKGIDWITNFY